jgi:polyvinyl alcohol dehydrogenase (cytochrome)
MYGHDLARTFSTPCPSTVNTTSVRTMLPAWFVKTQKTVTASPVVADGVLYVGDWSGTMYSIDARSGITRWAVQTPPAPGAEFGPIVSSAAVTKVDGITRIVFGAGPRVIALDPTGRTVWSHYAGATDANGTPKLKDDPAEVESSPLVWNDTVYVGMETHNHPAAQSGGIRGGLLALDVRTGEQKWKFEPDRGHGCGGVWSSPALDVKRKALIVATGNCRGGREAWTKYVEAIVALDAITGKPRWSFQPHAPNRDDHDFGATPNLFTDDKGRELIGAGNKDGAYHAVDAATGRRAWSASVARPGDIDEDFSIGGFIGSTAAWQGRVFGGTAIGGPPYFHAIDARTGTVVWRGVQAPTYAGSAVVNGVVFHGALDGVLRALDADSGLPLWAAPLAGPISSAPAIVDDSVYVGSGTSSSDLCAKDLPGSELCVQAFDSVLGRTGGIHAFRVYAAAIAGPRERLVNGQGNQLDQYDLSVDPPRWSIWQPNAEHGGKDLNAQICTLEKGKYILLGEDSGQPNPPAGWGIFDLKTKREVGKLTATYGKTPQPEQYGCAIETKKGKTSRFFVTQVGSGDFSQSDGQLIVFFPSSPGFDAVTGKRTADQVCPNGRCTTTATQSDFCVIDPSIRTAGGMAMDAKGNLYVTESSPMVPPDVPAPGRVLRYRPPFPTSSKTCFTKEPEVFISDPLTATPGAIVAARDVHGKPTGHWYVSSVLVPSVINEYDEDGTFVRNVLPPGFGTPFGLAVDSHGTLYAADIGVTVDPASIATDPSRFGITTRDGEGSVMRIRFLNGLPLPPDYLKTGLDYPDGLGIVPAA